jgi:diguanylate cyclase (GGDEF)-like protein
MFQRFDHGTRISILAGAIAFLVLLNGAFALLWTTSIKDEFSEVSQKDLPLWGMTARLIEARLEESLLFEQAWLATEPSVAPRLREDVARRIEAFAEQGREVDAAVQRETAFARQTLAASAPEHPERTSGEAEALLDRLDQQHERYLEHSHESLNLLQRHAVDDAMEVRLLAERYERLMAQTMMALQKRVDRFTASSARTVRRGETGLQHALATFTLGAFLIGVFMLRGIKRISDDRREAMRQLEILAVRDPLTGVANRRHFEARLREAVSAASRYGDSLTLCLVDLDYFKQVNDQHGHSAGDDVLRRFAQAAAREVREVDLIGRLGGDEFAILFWHTAVHEARLVVERIRERFARESFAQKDGGCFQLSATFGLAELSPAHADAEALLVAADQALYQAKANGRNCTFAAPLPPPA